MMAPYTIAVLAGGTGGHVFPAESVCEKMSEHRLIWLGNARGLEKTAAERVGAGFIDFEFCSPRKSLFGCLSQLLTACRKIDRCFVDQRPNLVIGFGGYMSVPGALVALWRKIPVVIHEQNSRLGLANRLIALWAKRIITAYPEVSAWRRPASRIGNPLRAVHGDQPRPVREFSGLDHDDGQRHILVLGGSQGAQQINSLIPQALHQARLNMKESLIWRIRHLSGERDLLRVKQAYHRLTIDAEVIAFSDQMAEHYDWAHLAVCRAGALTLAELAHHALPAVLLPLARSAGHHQYANAGYFAAVGGATALEDGADLESRLSQTLLDTLSSAATLSAMSAAMHRLATPHAAERFVEAVLPYSQGGTNYA